MTTSAGESTESEAARKPPRSVHWWLLRGVIAIVTMGLLVFGGSLAWVYIMAGNLYEPGESPKAPVAIVFGAQLAPGGKQPWNMLRNRLDATVEVFRAGKAEVILVSGDAAGDSGNETAVMKDYLVQQGIPAERIVADPHGLNSYDACIRARDVFGVEDALLISQEAHIRRTAAMCRSLGIDAVGVVAPCGDCTRWIIIRNTVRDTLAAPKAFWEGIFHRSPTVHSPPSNALSELLSAASAER